MNTKQRVQVPFGLKKKLMAATSMLLVAAIMLVSTSYAWFTLSTAPEITGITTSVGANGNLEIALLNTETFDNMTAITSNTGDSMEASGQSKAAANITWGNLIDLADESYGLTNVKMYPSALNTTTTGFNQTSPLQTPEYGADGRVTTMNSTSTTTAIYDGTAFAETGYGVRAVGVSSNVSPRQLAFTSAKANFSQASKSAQAATKSAVTANANSLLSIATGGATPTSYTYAQVENMKAIAVGIQNSLNSIVSAYANAIIAAAAEPNNGISDEEVALLNSTLSGVTSASSLLSKLGSFSEVEVDDTYTEDLSALATEQTTVASAISIANGLLEKNSTKAEFTDTSDFDTNGTKDATDITNGMASPLVGGKDGLKAYDSGNKAVTISVDNINAIINEAKSIYIGDGAVSTVAEYTGTFKITEALGIGVFAGVNVDGLNADGSSENNTASNKLKDVSEAVNALNSTFGEGTANISDFYGYIIDFAFRTNAANSNLLLQTEAVNRVYSNVEGADLATMGGGSFGSFDYNGLTYTQGKNLLESYRVVFFNPTDGAIYGTAKFADITDTEPTEGTVITGKLELTTTNTTEGKYTLGQDAYELDSNKHVLKDSITVGDVVVDLTTNTYADAKIVTSLPTAPTTTANGGTYTLGQDAYEAAYTVKTSVTVGGTDVTIGTDTCNTYETTLGATAYAALAETTVKAADTTTESFTGGDTLTSLPQNTPVQMSVLVYLDGNNIDNSAVNAVGTSGSLSLNLQFASDANLVPMENSALKTKTNTPAGGEG